MKKKGFTLVELLAVIVILALVAIISIPLIGNVIENVKEQSLKQSANGLIEAADFYYSTHQDIVEPITFDFVGGSQISEKKLEYKGNIKEGKLILSTNGESVICIGDGKYYAYKGIEDNEVVTGEGSCEYDGENFIITSDIDTLRKEIKEGKKAIASAITNKGVETSNTDSFTNMATNIGSIQTGIDEEEVKASLMDALKNTNFITSDMTYSQVLAVLKNQYPNTIDMLSTSLWSYSNTAGTYGGIDGVSGVSLNVGQITQGPVEYLAVRSGVGTSSYVDITNMNKLIIDGAWNFFYGSSYSNYVHVKFVLEDALGRTLVTIADTDVSGTSGTPITNEIDVSSYTGMVRLSITCSTISNWWNYYAFTTLKFISNE